MELIRNIMLMMIDISGIIWYTDPIWFWVQRNRERKKNKIINSLIDVINDMISLKELNLLAILCILIE